MKTTKTTKMAAPKMKMGGSTKKKMQKGGSIKADAPMEKTKETLSPKPKPKTGTDAIKEIGKYVSTFGGATERDDPKQKDINIVKKLKETGSTVKNALGFKYGGATMYKKGGALKKVDKTKNPGLDKLPKEVKNKMGYMKKGGSIKKKM